MSRSKIDGSGVSQGGRTNSLSKRAKKGKLTTIERTCPACNHHKALSTISKIKCSKCGHRHR
jgi:ribosomal protein L32